jgi:hypothetical protein
MIMKKTAFIFCAALALLACSKDDTDVQNEYTDKFSDLEYFQDGLVRLDSLGNILGYNVGKNLNEADPAEISVPVDSYEEARDRFLEWLPEGVQPVVNGKKYTCQMTDEENQPEGQVVFAESTDQGVLAKISVTAKGPKINSVLFIPTTAWPENSSEIEEYLEENYYLGAEVEVTEDKGYGKGTFIVIREWSPKENGIMIRMEGEKYEQMWNSYNRDKTSSINTTQTVSKVLHQGNNYDYIVNTYGKAHGWPSLNERYLTKKIKKKFLTKYFTFVNLETGKEGTFSNSLFDNQSWYRVFIYWFAPSGNKVKIW